MFLASILQKVLSSPLIIKPSLFCFEIPTRAMLLLDIGSVICWDTTEKRGVENVIFIQLIKQGLPRCCISTKWPIFRWSPSWQRVVAFSSGGKSAWVQKATVAFLSFAFEQLCCTQYSTLLCPAKFIKIISVRCLCQWLGTPCAQKSKKPNKERCETLAKCLLNQFLLWTKKFLSKGMVSWWERTCCALGRKAKTRAQVLKGSCLKKSSF